jgi:hypothetical protein
MAATIEVKIAGRGAVRAGQKREDAGTKAECDLCGAATDAVASVTPDGSAPFACKACLRGRLEAITVAAWELRGPEGTGLPWGKVSG